MILKSGETYYFVAHFVKDGASATGLTVEFRVYKVGSTSPTTISATEMGDGLYYCSFEPTSDGEYIAVAHTDGTADQKDIPCYSMTAIPAKEETADAVWDEEISGHNTAGTFGAKNQNKVPSESVDDYKADVSALALESTAQAIKSQTDKLQFDGSNNVQARVNNKGVLNDPSAEDIADAVWDESISDHTTSGTFGAKNQNKVPSEDVDDYKADVSSLALESTAQAIKSQTDKMQFDDNNYIKANVQDKGVLNDPSVTDIDDQLSSTHGSGSWETGSGGATASEIADAVWNEPISEHTTPGTFGAKNQRVVPSEDVDDYKADVSSLALESTAQAIKSQTDKLQFDGSNNVQARVNDKGVLNDPSAADVADAVWDEPIADHTTSGTFGAKNQNKVPSEDVDDYKADVSAVALESTAQAIKAQTDKLSFDSNDYVKANVQDKGVLNDPSVTDIDNQLSATHGEGSWEGGGGGATAEEIADAVWDEPRSEHTAEGSFGEANQNNPPSVSQIDAALSSSHGSGSWESGSATVNLISVLRMSEDQFIAYMGNVANKPIEVFKGDSLRVDITLVDADGNAVDVTNATAKFTVRQHESDNDYVLQKTLQMVDPTAGRMRLALDPTDTDKTPGTYVGDIEITFPDGRVKTVWKSQFIIKWDVTR